MSLIAKTASLLKRFRAAREGTVAIMAGLSAVPFFVAAGVAVDYATVYSVKTKMQTALDGATLAAAASPSLSDSQRIALAEKMFARNWGDDVSAGIDADPVFRIRDGQVIGRVDTRVPTAIMRVAGIDSMDIGADTVVAIPGEKNAEVVLVLDYSYSMTETSGGKVKYVAMRDAAKKLAEDLGKLGGGRIKMGLVPFSQHVYATLPKAFVVGQAGAGMWSGCTFDRKYPHNVSDGTPTVSDETKWGQPGRSNSNTGKVPNCDVYVRRNLQVMPLTDDVDAIQVKLDAMRPLDYTHIAVGAEFGWHLLAPNQPFDQAAPYDDKKTDKIIVILTDGRQTEFAFGPGGRRSLRDGEQNLEAICQGMKARKITVMTIAYDLRDDDTENRLRNCSTDPDKHFYIAEDGGDIATAFEQIKTQITAQIHIEK